MSVRENRGRVVAWIDEYVWLANDAGTGGELPEDMFRMFVDALAQCAPEFSRLQGRRAFVNAWLDRADQDARRRVSLTYCAAALSLAVGAFGDSKGMGETLAEARRRVEKAFRASVKR